MESTTELQQEIDLLKLRLKRIEDLFHCDLFGHELILVDGKHNIWWGNDFYKCKDCHNEFSVQDKNVKIRLSSTNM